MRALGHDVRSFNYHTQLAFYNKAFEFWQRSNPENGVTNPGEAVLLLTSEQAVLEAVDFVPHVVLIVNGFALHRRAYDLIHRLCLPMALVLTESPYLDEEQVKIASQGHVQLVFTNDKTSVLPFQEAAGVPTYYLPHSYNAGNHYPREVLQEYQSDVFFCGTLWPERARLLYPFKQWVHRWHRDWRLIVNGIALMTGSNSDALVDNNVLAEHYCGTRIALNHNRTIRAIDFTRGREEMHIGGAWSLGPRAFEIAACGAFQLCDDSRPELAEVFGDSVATYSDAADLRRKTAYYLTHETERQEMAEESYRRVQLCSFEQRAKQVMIPAIQEVLQHG